ncbi:MAG TPA: hypothetical protein VLA50_10515, partial [Erythrobacter sp.]|nr:hypothetical protein [Erythrobacter sp.]
MSEEDQLLAQVHADIYLFEIVQPAIGYARFGSVYKRMNSASRKVALGEVVSNVASTTWTNVTAKHTPGGLDMRFEPDTRALIFIATPGLFGGEGTVFGGKTAVDLDVVGKGTKKIIAACLRHKDGSGAESVCSFVFDAKPVTDEVSSRPTRHRVTRLPIMFDFVDLPDKV